MLNKIRILWLQLKIRRLERDSERLPFVRPIIEDQIEAVELEIFRLEHAASNYSGMKKAGLVMLMLVLWVAVMAEVMRQLTS